MASPLIPRITPLLEPGEQVTFAFTGQTGLNPAWRWLSFWLIVANKPRIVAVTDRRIVVLSAGQFRWMRTKPKAVLASVPRTTPLSHGAGSWSKVAVAGQQIWMHKRSYPLLDRANAGAAAS